MVVDIRSEGYSGLLSLCRGPRGDGGTRFFSGIGKIMYIQSIKIHCFVALSVGNDTAWLCIYIRTSKEG